MNKGELVDKVAEKATVTKKQADAVLSAALEAIMEAVSEVTKSLWWASVLSSRGSVKPVKVAIRKPVTRWKSQQPKFLPFLPGSCLRRKLRLKNNS
jgi:hypothetical protein